MKSPATLYFPKNTDEIIHLAIKISESVLLHVQAIYFHLLFRRMKLLIFIDERHGKPLSVRLEPIEQISIWQEMCTPLHSVDRRDFKIIIKKRSLSTPIGGYIAFPTAIYLRR